MLLTAIIHTTRRRVSNIMDMVVLKWKR